MNIATLMGTFSQQPIKSDGQNLFASDKSGEGDFSQILQTMAIENSQQGIIENVMTNDQDQTISSQELLASLDQYKSILDLLENDSELSPEEASVTLTEMMAALQPLVNMDPTTPLAEQVDSLTETNSGEAISLEGDADVVVSTTMQALASLLSSGLQQSKTTPQQTSSGEHVEPRLTAAATKGSVEASQADPPVARFTGGNAQSELPKTAGSMAKAIEVNSQVNSPQPSEAVAASSIPASNEAPSLATTFDQVLKNLPITTNPTEMAKATDEASTLPKTEMQSNVTTPVVQQAAAGAPTATFVVSDVAATSTAIPELPDASALHQIVDTVRLMAREGKTEVRLHLKPESLGQLLVQLHFTDGQVSVQMLTETSHAQSLIQDHLAHLKSAFAAQGFQIDGVNVTIGNDASAFDTPSHQSNDGTQQSTYQQPNVLSEDTSQSTTTQPASNVPSGLHAVDYQI